MPRLAPSLLWRAHRASPHLAALLPACRDLASARNELRWIREHVLASSSSSSSSSPSPPGKVEAEVEVEARIARLCGRRGRRGVPLQYVLGSQPFGGLDVGCRRGVLIPRAETEAWVYGVAGLAGGATQTATTTTTELRIVDFCTGTGCVALLLYSLLSVRRGDGESSSSFAQSRRRRLSVYGFDVDEKAVALARRNLAANVRRGSLRLQQQQEGPEPSPDNKNDSIVFEKADVFSDDWRSYLPRSSGGKGGDGTANAENAEEEEDRRRRKIDVLVANPPYISARGFDRDTGRSVRNHEPKLALVPDPGLLPLLLSSRRDNGSSVEGGVRPEDVFYARLLQIAEQTRPRITAFEVGDLAQAVRVVELALTMMTGTRKDGLVGGGGGGGEEEGSGAVEIEVEIWRDWPDMVPSVGEAQVIVVRGIDVPVKGSGNGRVVVFHRRGDGAKTSSLIGEC